MIKNNNILTKFITNNIYKIVGTLFLFILSMLIWLIFKANYIATTYSSRVIALNEINIETTAAHLWFEELLSGDTNIEISTVFTHIKTAKKFSQALKLKNNSLNISALDKPTQLKHLDDVIVLLKEFDRLAVERYEHNKISKPGTSIDQNFDSVFLLMIKESNTLKALIKDELKLESEKFTIIQYLVVLFEILSFLTATFAIYVFSKNAENLIDKLEDSNSNLEQKVSFRTKELDSALSDLKKSQNRIIETEKMVALGALVAGVSHEINTPVGSSFTAITQLRSENEIITKAYKERSMTNTIFENFLLKSNEISEIVEISLKNTLDLVKNFKMIAIDQSIDEERVFFLKEYMQGILKSLRTEIKKRKIIINLSCDDDIKIKSNPAFFVQIITNLVQNSITHAFLDTKDALINIDITFSDDLHIVYTDNGKGINKKDMSKIFDPFFTTNRSNGGTGLGLNIVQNLVVQQLNGKIKCLNDSKEGVLFLINIPKNKIIYKG